MSRGRVMVAGIGNVFLGDDGFGVEVVNRMDRAMLPPDVDVTDVGIRGVHLAYELLDGRHRTLILVDALPLDEPPGTLAVLEVPEAAEDDEPVTVDAHGMTPQAVLSALHNLGGRVDRVLVVGCQPASLTQGMSLSEPVGAAVEEAVRIVTSLAIEESVGTGREAPCTS